MKRKRPLLVEELEKHYNPTNREKFLKKFGKKGNIKIREKVKKNV